MIDFDHIEAVSTELLDNRSLLNRVDTKFVLRTSELPDLMRHLDAHDYGAVKHVGNPVFEYENLYFDTPDRSLLRDHHRGRRPRYKVRMRHHLSRHISFFELKQKRPSEITTKERIPIDFKSEQMGEAHSAILKGRPHLKYSELQPAMRIGFQRSMLVGLNTPERISIDTGLWFSDGQAKAHLKELVIVEVKQARFAARSPIMKALHAQGALQLRVSKYITAAQLIWPDVRLNRYRNRLRMLRRRTVT